MLDLIYDWLFGLLPEKLQWLLLGMLVLVAGALFGLGWYLSR